MLLELAVQPAGKMLTLREISHAQDISEKYLWSLVNPLKAAGILAADRGAHGGYSLLRDPAGITIHELLQVLEGGICLASCYKQSPPCERIGDCVARDVWLELEGKINAALATVTLGQMAERYKKQQVPAAEAAMFFI